MLYISFYYQIAQFIFRNKIILKYLYILFQDQANFSTTIKVDLFYTENESKLRTRLVYI